MSDLIDKVGQSVIGHRCRIETAFGAKPLIYADYTASGRSLSFVEDYIRNQVLPWYGNTHSESSFTGARTTAMREWARERIRQAVGAGQDSRVIFCGSGATAAVDRLIALLGLRSSVGDQDSDITGSPDRPLVLIGPYEHHSNELPWRESRADVAVVPLNDAGRIDLAALEGILVENASRPLLIGSFSAASNVTGVRSDIAAVSAVLKRFGALVCWDYAAAGPYVGIDMDAECPIDAIFLSPHKFIGGPGTPGVLVLRQSLVRSRIPAVVGGGTVSYVTPVDHRYVEDVERREEAGTPAIVEAIRAGLVFDLQQQVGTKEIALRESRLAEKAMRRLCAIPGIEVLGSTTAERLPIFSLRFHHNGGELHYGFIVALLNDLFGIQARGGCSCAGPYAHSLLGLTLEHSRRIEQAVASGQGILRPGWVRLGFNYFISEEEFHFILDALELVARMGWRLLPAYQYDEQHQVWRSRSAGQAGFAPAAHWYDRVAEQVPEPHQQALGEVLADAERLLVGARCHAVDAVDPQLPVALQTLRWYINPSEIAGSAVSC